MRVTNNETYPEVRDALSADWSQYINKIMPEATLVPLLNEPKNVIRTMKELKLDGVILSNGNDWGEAKNRDETEKKVVDYCLKNRLPVLGVCRGFYVLNILLGGKFDKNISGKIGENHAGTVHQVEINGKIVNVNSYHNHGVLIGSLAPELKVLAKTKSGLVEAFYHPKKSILAMQWHPERKSPDEKFTKTLDALIKDFFKR